jgi:hypothetical protein
MGKPSFHRFMSNTRRGRPILRKLALSAFAAAALAGLALPSAAQSPGQPGYKRALMSDFAINFVNTQAQLGGNLIANALETALKRSRDTVRVDSKPVPEEVIKALTPFYKKETFEGVRYAVGDISPTGLAGFAIRNGNAAAVTLIDTIVFKDEDYVKNLALWSHEMHHIEQYKEWGLSGFASRYAFGWTQVEEEAEAKAQEFVSWYRDQHGKN